MEFKSPEEVEALKRTLYEKLSKRQRKYVDRIGYEAWEPFQMPNDPLDIRQDKSGYTAQELALMFFRELGEDVPENYRAAVTEFAIQLLAQPERCRPVVEFCAWYTDLLRQQGKTF